MGDNALAKKKHVEEGRLPRSVIRKAWLYNLVFRAGGGYTYSMAAREASTMGIILSHLYDNKEDVGRELEKYYRYYNTNIPMDGLIAGLIINMEEQRAENPDLVSPQAIQAVQTLSLIHILQRAARMLCPSFKKPLTNRITYHNIMI